MLWKKITSALLTAAVGMSLMCGCTADTGETSDGEGFTPALDTNISASFTVIGNYDNFEALEAAILSFQEIYPNIDIVYEKLDDYNSNLETRLASDSSVGMFMINRYNFIISPGIIDYTTDINTIDINFDVINDEAVNGCYVDGKLFGIPLWFKFYGVVVNEDLIAENNLTVPTDLSEFNACCDALIEAGYTPLQQAPNAIVNYYRSMAMNLIKNNCSSSQIESLLNGEEGSAEVLRPVFDLMLEHLDKGYTSIENAAGYEDNYNAAILNFFEGETPFLIVTSQTVTGMEKRESRSETYSANPFEYSFIFTPFTDDGALVYVGDDTGFGLSNNCSEYDAAAEFYRFCYTEEILNQFSEIKGAPSTALNATNELYSSINDIPDDRIAVFGDFNDPTNIIDDVYNDVSSMIYTGEITDSDTAIATFEELARAVE